MGSLQAQEFAAMDVNLDQAMAWHLQSNHYPPVPTSMIVVCVEAIELANMGEWDDEIILPPGVTFRGSDAAPVHEIVNAHHLDAWIEREDF